MTARDLISAALTGLVFGGMLLAPLSSGAEDCGAADAPCRIDSGSYHILEPDGPPSGIVMHLHGGGGTGKGLLKGGMAKEAIRRGYIFVAPNGEHPTGRFHNNWAVRAKNFGHEKDDIAFLRDVLADVSSRRGIERPVMLLSGFSRGGSMVWDVACHAPDLARAYAASAGAFWDDLPEACAAPVWLHHTHGWSDRTVPLEGRPLFGEEIFQGDVWESLRIMRETNGCANRQPASSEIDGDRWRRQWTDCSDGRIDLTLHPGGHGAPSGWAKEVLDWFEAILMKES